MAITASPVVGATAVGAALIALVAIAATAQSLPEERLDDLRLPPGYTIELFATDVPGARTLVVADDGARVYVGTRGQRLYQVLDPDRDGRADQVELIANGLQAPNGLVLTEAGLVVVEQHRIVRLTAAGDLDVLVPPGTLPDHPHHGWRYADLGPDGRLYVAVGAPCNICETEGLEGTIVRMAPDGTDLEVFARGVRNSVGFDWQPATGVLYFTDNGGDQIGDLIPPDEFNRAAAPGGHFGYPYRHAPGEAYPQFAAQEPPEPVIDPVIMFEAHAAALGVDFYTGPMFPADLRHDALVAQHGSWNRTDPVGYRIMRIRFDAAGEPVAKEVFIDGWLDPDGTAWGRPVDLEELPDGSLLISDDHAGVIYRLSYGR